MVNGTQELEGPVCGASDPPEEVTSSFVPGWGVLPGLGATDLSEHNPQIVMKSGNSLIGCSEGSSGGKFSLVERQLIMMPESSKTLGANNTDFRELDPT